MRLVHVVLVLGTAVLIGGCEERGGIIEPDPTPALSWEEAYSFPWLPEGDFILRMGFQSTGALWVTTFEGVIIRVDNGEMTTYDAAAVVGDGRLRDLFIDESDRVWVTAGASLAVYEAGSWSVQGPEDLIGLAGVATEVAVNSAGDIALAMGNTVSGGLLLRRGGQWRSLTPENSSLPSPLVLSIEVRPDDAFWVGSAQFQGRGGLSLLKGGEIVTILDTADGVLYNWIDDLATSGLRVFGGFWVPIYNDPDVAEGGIQEISATEGVIRSWFPLSSGLTSNRVLALTYSSSGELWFSTIGPEAACDLCVSGVGVLTSSDEFQILSARNGDVDPNEFLPDIAEGPDGAIYVLRADKRQVMRVIR